jgi:CspA family cold shock protein
MQERFNGIVKWFSNERGFGFVHSLNENGDIDESSEYFVHFSSINVKGFKSLNANQLITFSLKDTPKGVQAINVDIIK